MDGWMEYWCTRWTRIADDCRDAQTLTAALEYYCSLARSGPHTAHISRIRIAHHRSHFLATRDSTTLSLEYRRPTLAYHSAHSTSTSARVSPRFACADYGIHCHLHQPLSLRVAPNSASLHPLSLQHHERTRQKARTANKARRTTDSWRDPFALCSCIFRRFVSGS